MSQPRGEGRATDSDSMPCIAICRPRGDVHAGSAVLTTLTLLRSEVVAGLEVLFSRSIQCASRELAPLCGLITTWNKTDSCIE
jgi:hypothetical protein